MGKGSEIINNYSGLDTSFSNMYAKYNNEVGDDSYKTECASFVSTGGVHKNNNVIFCKKLLRNTSSFDNLGAEILSDKSKRCSYLNIWLNDQIVNNNIACNVVDGILSKSDGRYKEHCELNKYKDDNSYVPISDLSIMNILYLFSENINTINSLLQNVNKPTEFSKGKDYLKKFTDIYNDNIKECLRDKGPRMCQALNDFRISYENDVLHEYQSIKEKLPTLCTLPKQDGQQVISNHICGKDPEEIENNVLDTLTSTPVVIPGTILGAMGTVISITSILYKVIPHCNKKYYIL
ncbi:Plasmodium vivax Vir protein, putative [Plasmodium vivax]|uniref:Vir protein, putative n=1 Tax=Plasmodium vivax TaxID=5855 RepID=A0A1G4HB40_PLAVI|nr:Plasmodium vivax Vir protein, putative [Plasmodium vivax]